MRTLVSVKYFLLYTYMSKASGYLHAHAMYVTLASIQHHTNTKLVKPQYGTATVVQYGCSGHHAKSVKGHKSV